MCLKDIQHARHGGKINMNVLISHLSTESRIATGLKDWLELEFAGQCAVILSSDPSNVPAGSKWFEEMDHALDASKVVLIICTPSSIQNPWINLHGCCATLKKIPGIALCISCLEGSSLPYSLSKFERVDLNQSDSFQKLSSVIAKELGIARPPGFFPSFDPPG